MSARRLTAELAVRADAVVGEGPVWDHRTGELAWVDITTGTLHRSAVAARGEGGPAGRDRAVGVGTLLGAVGLRAAGGYVAAVADGLGFLDLDGDGDATLTVAEPILPEADRRMNDAKCDRAGRYWAGSTTMPFVPDRGALHRWDPGAGTTVVADGLTLPNGLGWSPDDRTFYLADSIPRVVYEHRFDAGPGTLGPRRVLLAFGERDGLPDGLCVDADGCLWLAMWGGGQVRRYAPDGRLDAVVDLPVSQPSSCAFGPGGVLYVTSARADLPPDRLAAEPLAGSVFAVTGGCDGVEIGVFAG